MVLTGIVLDTIGMAFFINIGADPSTLRILAGLFVMGLGMGCTMMPMFSAALATLRHEHIARGSTLLNVTQQVAASIGTAIFAVILTNGFMSRDAAVTLIGLGKELEKAGGPAQADPSLLQKIAAATPDGLVAFGEAFSGVFLIATILIGLCFIPALFLPRHKVAPVDPAAMMGH